MTEQLSLLLVSSLGLGHSGFLAAPQTGPALSFCKAFTSATPWVLSFLPLGNHSANFSLCASLCTTVRPLGKSVLSQRAPTPPCWFVYLLPLSLQHWSLLHIIVRMNSPVFFLPYHLAYGILVPWPGMEPVCLALEAWSLNHWTTRQVPRIQFVCVFKSVFPYSLRAGSWFYAQILPGPQ